MTFEHVGEDERERYPTGVKVTYEAYDQNEALEVVDDPKKESITGLIPQLTLSPPLPSEDEAPLCILKAIPGAGRTIEVDPFIAGSRQFAEACCDKMERTYLDKKPEVAAEWRKWKDEVIPQSDNATDYIAEHPLYIPFLERLFSGAVMSDYEVNPRTKAPSRIKNGKILPDMRVVTATSSVVHSGDKKKKKSSRLVIETADGENVADQGIPARAHIKPPPRKPRAKKAVTKKSASKKKVDAKKKTAATPKKRGPKKTATVLEESEEEVEDESSSSEEEPDEDFVNTDGPQQDGTDIMIDKFDIGDRVKNSLGLRGVVVVECNRERGTYSVEYTDGQKDQKLQARHLTRLPQG